MPKPKILVFSHAFSPSAPSLYARIYDEYLELSKYVKLIVVAEEITEKESENISLNKVTKIPGRFITVINRSIVFFLASIKQRKNYSIIYLRVLDFAFLASCILAKKFLNKKLIIWISNAETGHKGWQRKIYRYLYKKILQISDVICSASNNDIDSAEKFIEKKLDIDKVYIIKPGINISRFKVQETNDDKKILLCVARIAPIKLIDHIIRSIPYIKNKFPDINLKLIGPIEDHDYYSELENLSQKLGCKENIEFLGPIQHDKLISYYNSASIFILMSKNETISQVTFEAMACGCPIIVAPTGSRKELIQDGVSGFLIDNKDPRVLAEKILELLENEEYRIKIGLQGRALVKQKMNFEHYIKNLSEIIINEKNF